MATYQFEYSTNVDDRRTAVVQAADLTEAYLKFIKDNPKDYIITDYQILKGN